MSSNLFHIYARYETKKIVAKLLVDNNCVKLFLAKGNFSEYKD